MLGNVGLAFSRPEALLLLLLLVPLAVYLSRTSLALLRRNRRRLSLALRIAVITLLVLALSGVSIVRAAGDLSVVFLVDRSDSIGAEQRSEQEAYIQNALASMGGNDHAGVVVFGADALVDRPVEPDKRPPDLTSAPTTTYSNLDAAIRLGLSIAPADTARRLVLLSDGKENAGSAEWAARLAAAHGTVIDTVPLASQTGPEVWVDSLNAPSPVREGERASLDITVQSSKDTTATVVLLVDGAPLSTQQVALARGSNSFVQSLPPAVKGFHTYSVQVAPAAGSDTRPENNRYSAFSLVLGKSRLLVVEGHPGEAAALKAALSPSVDVDVIAPETMPADPKTLAGYDGVVLVNVPATSLTRKTMDNLQLAVRDLGKGLVVIGGDESYAAGGYFRTPLEAMLPVDLNLPSKLDIPSVGMVLVIDRSGSMEESHSSTGGVKKIELAKEAAYQAVAQLSERDYVGVVAFDSAANWVVDLQPLGDPTRFRDRIGGVMSGGGTNIYSGLAPAVDALVGSKARSKHIVLLTDGQSEGGDYDGLVKKMQANQITLSTVAVGADADTNFLQNLASAGGGRYYYTEDGNALPQIFAHESHLAARSYIIEHTFSPERSAPSTILDGLGGLPALQGYVGTSSRPGGQVSLVSDAGDPVLAQWQYGLGRVVAWTSDTKGQWAKDWVGWQDFARFWAQTVRWSIGVEAATALQPHVDVEAGKAHITVDATAPDGSYLNNLSASAVVVSPGLVTSTVALRQSAPGRYEADFPATEEGAYLLQVQASGQNVGSMRQTLGLVVPYSPEYRGDATDNGLLGRLANITGGRVLQPDQARAAFDHNLLQVQTSTDLWPLLLLLAILLVPFDVGVRRVAMSRADMIRAWARLRQRMGWGQRAIPAVAGGATPPEMAALFTAKDRVRQRVEPEMQGPAPEGSLPDWARDLPVTGRTGRASPVSAPPTPTQQPPEPTPVPANAGEDLAARLRKAREQRR